MSAVLTAIIAFVSIILPGFFLAFALLRKTKLNLFEITTIGFMFGLIFPPTLTWLESYLTAYVHSFTFSAGLYAANVVFLTLVGIALSIQQGAFGMGFTGGESASQITAEMEDAYKMRLFELRSRISKLNIGTTVVREHQQEEQELARRHLEESGKARNLSQEERAKLEEMHLEEEKKLIAQHEKEEEMLVSGAGSKQKINIIWVALLFLMLFTFATRMMSFGIAPHFFEFDPYFDMQSSEFVLTHGYQWLYDHSSWPTAINGTPHRIEPIVPYLEAYWYQIANPPLNQIDQTLLSDVGSFYPPIVAALLVFIVFQFLYHTYGEFPALVGAILATAMPALITTFIAGEQLLEPWGIFAMFFFYVSYLLAVQNMKEVRFAILAGIAFAASFLGAHYYTVIAGVFAIYIGLQGIVDVLRNRNTRDFYKMNVIIIGIIALFYILFDPYNTVLTNKIPSVAGVPVIVSFPLLALIFVYLLEKAPIIAQKRKWIEKADISIYVGWLVVLGLIGLLLLYLTPIGKSVTGYLSLSSHFTTPSIALFMTVQEYAPTGFNFDFGSGGFGGIGQYILGTNAIVWFILILFSIFAILAIYNRDSKDSILSMAAIWPLAIAGMIEIKYLPHFGVGYIIAFCVIIGELMLATKSSKTDLPKLLVFFFGVLIVLIEAAPVFYGLSIAAVNPSCSNPSNALGYDVYCNVVPQSWLNATAWMKQNVGPYAPRILSWWDYGDWINWFGNSNAVLRGDNSIAKLDYQTAARYVLGPKDGYGPSNLVNFSNRVAQSKYVLFDDQLTAKWQALNFLACVNVNQTSRAFAIQQANGTTAPYILGSSQCEISHDPAYILLPLNTNNINNYCQFQNKTSAALKSILLIGNTFSNQTFCVPANITTSNGALRLLNSSGDLTNVLIVPKPQFYAGLVPIGGQNFVSFLAIYLPNGPNDTITNAPSQFYNSNYYRGFYLGKLPGFHMAYPSTFNGINYVNSTSPVVIYQINNYTGALPYVTPKPSWVQNNFTMPG